MICSSMETLYQFSETFLTIIEPHAISLFQKLIQARNYVNASCRETEPYLLILITTLATWVILGVVNWCLSISDTDEGLWKRIKSRAFKVLINVPFIKGFAQKELDKTKKSIQSELMKPYEGTKFIEELPRERLSTSQVLEKLESYQKLGNVKWLEGRVSGGIYAEMSNKSFQELMQKVYGETAFTNPLHPDVFPGIRKMEAEVVRIACRLFNGDDETCGTMTSGGTESIVLSCKAFRDYARKEKGITSPEILVPQTAHAAFDKAGQMLKIKIIHVPVDSKTMKVNIKSMRSLISSRTILLAGSSPNFPNGIIDDIEEISKLGIRYNIPVHVDACLGGFLVPFMEESGFPIPPTDFRLPGVSAISADTHKYAYAPKGSSVILYRLPEYRHQQFAVCTDWPGGVYASPTISGSRAGGVIATCWASLLYHGRNGYVDSTTKIMKVTRYLKAEISKIPGIFIYGDPLMSVLAIGSDDFNVLEMSEEMSKRGWNLNTLQFPSGFHICVTLMQTIDGVADTMIRDMREIAAKLVNSPKSKLTGQAAVYGMAQALPDRSLISDFAMIYMDAYYSTKMN